MIKHKYVINLALVVASTLIYSCAVLPDRSSASIVEEGSRLFSEGRVLEAEASWARLLDPAMREEYRSFAAAYAAFDEAVAAAEKALASGDPAAAIAAASAAGSLPAAPAAVGTPDPRDAAARLSRVSAKAGAALALRAAKVESEADERLAKAQSGAMPDRVEAASEALGGFTEAARLYRDAKVWVPQAEADAKRASTKASGAEELQRTLLRESLLSFPDRMGAVFARSPEDPKKLDDKALLAFNAETASLIQGGIEEFDRIVSENPGLIDQATAERLRLSASSLSPRFARMEGAIKSTKNRGRPVMPLIVGIFNPQPGDPQRSRPGNFGGGRVSGSDWWWGIADIPKGLAQDLVVTMSDSRPVRVYAAGKGSGGGKTASDLVNPLFKVGNSWPVLNAGERLENGVFHIEVGPGSVSGYSGEAVVYKSFVTRTR
jgi:hypothetical protein